jgi:hypothetical protein
VVKVSASQPVDHGLGSSPNGVTTMFLHMIPVLVGSRMQTRK